MPTYEMFRFVTTRRLERYKFSAGNDTEAKHQYEQIAAGETSVTFDLKEEFEPDGGADEHFMLHGEDGEIIADTDDKKQA